MTLVAGCWGGGERDRDDVASKTPAQQMNEALSNLKGYSSLRLSGLYQRDLPELLDLRVDREGNCVGTRTVVEGVTEIVSLAGGPTWVRLDEKALEDARALSTLVAKHEGAAVDAAVKRARGKYIEVPARVWTEWRKPDAALSLCDLDSALAPVPSTVRDAARANTLNKDGHKVVPLEQQTDGYPVTVHIPEKGPLAPTYIEYALAGDPVALDLAEPDAPVEPVAPNPEDSIAYSDVEALFEY
ncbi:hypothetical protein ACIBI4_04545 [Streptomyces sp. NPDC050418]|uniref:hypothetical protein n=1 Tax=Streptomyces sp. NPDC050418 TaxID=3365612 RepID=UPI0037B33972